MKKMISLRIDESILKKIDAAAAAAARTRTNMIEKILIDYEIKSVLKKIKSWKPKTRTKQNEHNFIL